MFKKIIIPLDGSTLAETVIPFVNEFATPANTKIELVSVIEPWRYVYANEFVDTSSLIVEMHKSSEQHLASQKESLAARGYTVSTHLVNGDPANEILGIADSTKADLIAMTTHGRSGLSRFAFGSVAEKVLHGASVPLLLVRNTTNKSADGIKRILLPLDGSKRSEQAVPVAESIAREANAQIALLEIVQHLDPKNQEIVFGTQEKAEAAYEEWIDHAEAYLQDVEHRLRGNHVEVKYLIGDDDPAATICKTAKSEKCDLVVLGSHGRTGLARWFYGSVASKVLREVDCPILLVHTRVENTEDATPDVELLAEFNGTSVSS